MANVSTVVVPVGDPDSFQDFITARGGHLYRTACLLTGGDTHLAEDLVQETLGRMYVRWGRPSRLENPSGYAQTTLVNTFISLRRKRSSSERPAEITVESAARGEDVPLRLTLLGALRQLSPQDRAVLVLRFWEDRSVEETAAALNLSSGAVRSRSSRALERMRGLLGETYAEIMER